MFNSRIEGNLGASVTRISHMEADPTWETETTILAVSYAMKELSANVAYLYRNEETTIKMPKRPVVLVAATYTKD